MVASPTNIPKSQRILAGQDADKRPYEGRCSQTTQSACPRLVFRDLDLFLAGVKWLFFGGSFSMDSLSEAPVTLAVTRRFSPSLKSQQLPRFICCTEHVGHTATQKNTTQTRQHGSQRTRDCHIILSSRQRSFNCSVFLRCMQHWFLFEGAKVKMYHHENPMMVWRQIWQSSSAFVFWKDRLNELVDLISACWARFSAASQDTMFTVCINLWWQEHN